MLRGGGAAGPGLGPSAPGIDRRGPAGAGFCRDREVFGVRPGESGMER